MPALALVLFFAGLVLLPVAAASWPSQWLALVDGFYRSGALVFGGGHVILPLLEAEVLPPGWVSRDAFLAGYGAAQALPGPLFTFAAYLGTVMEVPPSGWRGAAICLGAIFLPSFLLVAGTLPWWTALGRLEATRRAMPGVNAAVVGLLLAALYDPVWIEGVRQAGDFVLALAAFRPARRVEGAALAGRAARRRRGVGDGVLRGVGSSFRPKPSRRGGGVEKSPSHGHEISPLAALGRNDDGGRPR